MKFDPTAPLTTFDLLIDGSIDNCMARGGAHRECGEVAGHLNRMFVGQLTKEIYPHTHAHMRDVTIMFGDMEMQEHVKTVAYVSYI